MSRTPSLAGPRRLDCGLLAVAVAAAAAGLVLARTERRQCDGPDEDARTLLLTAADAACVSRNRPVELHELARQVIDEFAGVRTPTIKLELAAPAVSALGNPAAVVQILRILLDNALRFAPAGSTVAVSAARRGRRCELTVSDWGPGIADGDRERIFERFQRAGQPGPDGGFGLGLAIGRDLARRLGGELRLSWAASPTRFTLELPAAGGWPPVADRRSRKSRPQADDTEAPARDDRASPSTRRMPMYRQARERIIALELMKLERRKALERERRAYHERRQPTGARRNPRSRPEGPGS